MMDIVDSVPTGKRRPNIDYSNAAHSATPGCAWLVGVPSLLLLVALVSSSDWASHTFLAGIWPYLIGFFALVLLPCVAVIGWRLHKAKKQHEYEQAKKENEQKLVQQQVKLTQQTNMLVQEARLQNDNVKIQFGDNGGLKSIEVIRAAMLAQEQQRTQVKQVSDRKQQGGVTGYSPVGALPAGLESTTSAAAVADLVEQEVSSQEEILLPVAPPFKEMFHLITTDRMPLCFVLRNEQVIPMFGTIDDLLSMAITGKPGRGKTVSLMYYVAMLLKSGAEVYVFDPHGAMAELAILNDRVLPGMPKTAKVHYYDRKDSITGAVPALYRELEDRDNYYRPQEGANGELLTHRVKHPLLILADELPILADFDEQVEAVYKRINRQRLKDGDDELEVPSLMYLIRRIVLEARKWRCFFIGSGQSMDAEVLPTKVTENLNSRIVFFSSNRRARMSGLENDAIKNLLPLIRRGGSGVMIYDCARWEEPLIGAIPYITVSDLMEYLGVVEGSATVLSRDDLGIVGAGSVSLVDGFSMSPKMDVEDSREVVNSVSVVRNTGELENPINALIEPLGSSPETSPFGSEDMQFSEEQVIEFIGLFKALRNRKEVLRRMRNPRTASGYGLGNRYDKHAKLLIEQYKLDQK